MKLEIIAPVPGRSFKIGDTVLIDEKQAQELIADGFAKVHPTESNPGPTHPCPCEDEHDEPCEECDEKKAVEEIKKNLITKNIKRVVKKSTSKKK